MFGRICISPSDTARAKSSPFAAKSNQLVFLTQGAVKPGHTVSKVYADEKASAGLEFFFEKTCR